MNHIHNFFMELKNNLDPFGVSISDLIGLIVSFIGLIISIIAIRLSNKSIKLTSESIYEANRPIVSAYIDYIYIHSSAHEYLFIKNFGNSNAIVTKIEFDKEMPVTHKDNTNLFSEYGLPFSLAPGQSFSTNLRINALNKDLEIDTDIYHGIIKVKITYTDHIKTFEETFELNQDTVKNLRLSKSNGSKSLEPGKAILHASEEIIRKLM